MNAEDLRRELAPAIGALERIAAALEVLAAVSMDVEGEPAPAEAPACLHPPELRISFGVTNGLPDWQCTACGYRTPTDLAGDGATH